MRKIKYLLTSVCAMTLLLAIASPAYAYIDPATTSYVIQIITGVVIACGAAVGIFWKKIRLFFRDKKMKSMEKKIAADAERKHKNS